jgi:hypothetical protein
MQQTRYSKGTGITGDQVIQMDKLINKREDKRDGTENQ